MTGIEQQEKQIRFQMFAQAKLRMEHLPDLLQECRPGLKFLAGQEVPSFSYQIGVNGKEKNVDVLALVLGLLEKFQILRENIT